jgi:hypothetical protein
MSQPFNLDGHPSPLGKPISAESKVKALVQDAVAVCCYHQDLDCIHYTDQALISESQSRDPDYGTLLKNLYWRGRQQSAIWDLFLLLVKGHFIKRENMAADVDYNARSVDPYKVYQRWMCFSYVKGSIDPKNGPSSVTSPRKCQRSG